MTTTTYQCFKAYEESTKYYKEGNVVTFRSVYQYAELEYFGSSQLPIQSEDGNYYDLPEPDKAELGHLFLDQVDFFFKNQIIEKVYKKHLSDFGVLEFEKLIIFLGYTKKIFQVMYGRGTIVNHSLSKNYSSMSTSSILVIN